MTTMKRHQTSALWLTSVTTFALGIILAFVLHVLETHFPVKPNWIWLEVVVGVLIVVGPVTYLRHAYGILMAATLETMMGIGFVSAGVPIIVWQLIIAR